MQEQDNAYQLKFSVYRRNSDVNQTACANCNIWRNQPGRFHDCEHKHFILDSIINEYDTCGLEKAATSISSVKSADECTAERFWERNQDVPILW